MTTTDEEKPDNILDLLDPVLEARADTNPWTASRKGREISSDQELLERMLTIPIREGTGSQSGRLAKSIDAWVAAELRRAGFAPDTVWPRPRRPRVLPQDVALFIEKLPKKLQAAARTSLLNNKTVAPTDAKVLGRAYVKQIDVLIAHWSRGVELLVSTKTMTSSFRKNLPNRFEEAYGDAKNLRGRFPLASMGFLFVLRSTALDVPGTLERAIDMMRKLKAESDVYDTTCLLVADWDDNRAVQILSDTVPDDLSADHFLTELIEVVLARTPVDMHVQVRELREHRSLPLGSSESHGEP